MTTSIEIRAFNGNKSVEIEVIRTTAAGPNTEKTITIKPGETCEAITLYDGVSVSAREIGEFIETKATPAQPAAPPAHASTPERAKPKS
jgi:hypothetical protein